MCKHGSAPDLEKVVPPSMALAVRKEVENTMHVPEQSGSTSICESFVCENVDSNGSILQLAWIMGSALGIWTVSVLNSCSGIHNVTTGIAHIRSIVVCY